MLKGRQPWLYDQRQMRNKVELIIIKSLKEVTGKFGRCSYLYVDRSYTLLKHVGCHVGRGTGIYLFSDESLPVTDLDETAAVNAAQILQTDGTPLVYLRLDRVVLANAGTLHAMAVQRVLVVRYYHDSLALGE